MVGADAGLIAPRTAGAAELRVTLLWPAPGPRGAGFSSPPLPAPLSAAVCGRAETPEGLEVRLEERILAPTAATLGAALDARARAAAAYAARAGAVLEMSTVCSAPPRVASRPALEALARDLVRAGFRVRFAPLGAPADAAEVWVGTAGPRGADLEAFLRSHPRWGALSGTLSGIQSGER